jgi:hypothetical protein
MGEFIDRPPTTEEITEIADGGIDGADLVYHVWTEFRGSTEEKLEAIRSARECGSIIPGVRYDSATGRTVETATAAQE